ncbi:MAG: hypothetical protein AAF449_07975, partial [Myxococcota bacterium]
DMSRPDPRHWLALDEQAERDFETDFRGFLTELLALRIGAEAAEWPFCGPNCSLDCVEPFAGECQSDLTK